MQGKNKWKNAEFLIGIPTINRADLLLPAIEGYLKLMPNTHIHIVDNGHQNIKEQSRVHVQDMEGNLGVAGSWNFLLKKIFLTHPYALILNDDVELGLTEGEVSAIIKKNVEASIIVSGLGWCAMILHKDVVDKVGEFDANFYPAYFEDNDFSYRIKLSGGFQATESALNPKVFRNSQTIFKDPKLNNNFTLNREYYVGKWGGTPMEEKFTTPFNS